MLMKTKKIFPGWLVVLGGLLIMVTIGGVAWNCVSQYIKPVCADLGFSRQAMSMCQTINSLVSMAISLSWGYILRHFSLKKLMRTAVFVLPAAYYGFSLCRSIWGFYLCAALQGLSLAFLMTLPLSMILSNWFEEKRGVAMGICFMGSGLGGMIFNPLVARVILRYGWRVAYRSMAGVMLAAAFVAVFFLLRCLRPEERGLRPLGWEKTHTDAPAAGMEEGESLGDLIRTARFRLMALSLCLSNTAVGCITQCLSPHLSDNGYTVQTAALLVSVGMGLLAVGKIILGELYDRIGTRRGTLLAMSCGLLGVVGMIFCRSRLGLAGIFLGQGIGCAFGTVGVPIVVQNLFGKKDYASNFGFISACTSVGGAISPTLNGAVFDHFGSYNPAFALWAVLLIGALAVYWVLLPREETHR